MSDNEHTVTQKEAADFLNVSTKSISRYRKRGLPYRMILNPVSGKQEVRFRQADLERWDEGRQLMANYGRSGEEILNEGRQTASMQKETAIGQNYLDDLLAAYKEQIELLRTQLEDMRTQLARRDRQIDDLMRLMVGLQLEYKPMPPEQGGQGIPEPPPPVFSPQAREIVTEMEAVVEVVPSSEPPPSPATEKTAPRKTFNREKLAASILHLRRKGRSYEDIARGLNQIKVAPPSGRSRWTTEEVQTLLPALVQANPAVIDGER